MRLLRGSLLVVAVATGLAATGCVLLFEDGSFQSITFHFTIDREIAADQPFDVETLIHPIDIGTRRLFAQISGMLMAPDGEEFPESVEVVVVTENAAGRRLDRIRKTLRIREDGGFKENQRLRRDIPAGSIQKITLEPDGVAIPSGTKIWLCLDVVEKRTDLADLTDCSVQEPDVPPAGGTVRVEVRDFSFNPRRVRIDPGQTVRWVRIGSNNAHTVTADLISEFDSGLSFDNPGDFFEVTFGADKNDQTFLYYCRTHQSCCQMQGSIQVGENAPDAPPGYD